MPDITMCSMGSCPDARECYRYMAVPKEYWQSFFGGHPGGKEACGYFVPILKTDIVRMDYEIRNR